MPGGTTNLITGTLNGGTSINANWDLSRKTNAIVIKVWMMWLGWKNKYDIERNNE